MLTSCQKVCADQLALILLLYLTNHWSGNHWSCVSPPASNTPPSRNQKFSLTGLNAYRPWRLCSWNPLWGWCWLTWRSSQGSPTGRQVDGLVDQPQRSSGMCALPTALLPPHKDFTAEKTTDISVIRNGDESPYRLVVVKLVLWIKTTWSWISSKRCTVTNSCKNTRHYRQ